MPLQIAFMSMDDWVLVNLSDTDIAALESYLFTMLTTTPIQPEGVVLRVGDFQEVKTDSPFPEDVAEHIGKHGFCVMHQPITVECTPISGAYVLLLQNKSRKQISYDLRFCAWSELSQPLPASVVLPQISSSTTHQTERARATIVAALQAWISDATADHRAGSVEHLPQGTAPMSDQEIGQLCNDIIKGVWRDCPWLDSDEICNIKAAITSWQCRSMESRSLQNPGYFREGDRRRLLTNEELDELCEKLDWYVG